jgi:pSer/pThr/pTyr-binding forkhead associated (FHA) protein
MNCPNGHLSTSTDFCSVCGINMATEPAAGASPQFETALSTTPVELAPDAPLATGSNPSDPSSGESTGAAWRVECRIFKEAGPEASTPGAPYESSTEIILRNQVTQIGRSSQKRNLHPEIACDWDDSVSHRHAKIELDTDGNAFLIDVGSTNGTMLNGQLISANSAVKLKDGDRISLGGRTALIVRAPEKENPQIT